MSRRTKLVGGSAVAALALLAAGGGLFWYVVLRGDAPPPVSLSGAIEALATATTTQDAAASTATAATGEPASARTSDGLDGTWTVDAAQDSFVGYRVGEELVGVGVTTAVGRTSAVSGEVVIDGNTVVSAVVRADLTRLRSDSGLRDGQLRRQGIETDRFPTSTFELTQPIALPEGAAAGQAFSVTLVGKLTLHGVTRAVEVPAEAQLVGENLVVVGSIEIVFADYDIQKPSAARVVAIEDHGIMELQLFLVRA
jgi:polyisoprenoid-binding protein YceI